MSLYLDLPPGMRRKNQLPIFLSSLSSGLGIAAPWSSQNLERCRSNAPKDSFDTYLGIVRAGSPRRDETLDQNSTTH